MNITTEPAFLYIAGPARQPWVFLDYPWNFVREDFPAIAHSPDWSRRKTPDGETLYWRPVRLTDLDMQASGIGVPAIGDMFPVYATLDGARVVGVSPRDFS